MNYLQQDPDGGKLPESVSGKGGVYAEWVRTVCGLLQKWTGIVRDCTRTIQGFSTFSVHSLCTTRALPVHYPYGCRPCASSCLVLK